MECLVVALRKSALQACMAGRLIGYRQGVHEMIRTKRQASKSNGEMGRASRAKPQHEVSHGSKVDRLEALLRRPEGATITDLAETLEWQPHSVRGAMSGFLKKKRGLTITGSKTDGGERVYRVAE